MAPTEICCSFCLKRVVLARSPDRLLAQAGRAALCRHCGAAWTLHGELALARSALGAALGLPGESLHLTVSPGIALAGGSTLHLVCAWNPAEMLSTIRVAQILDLHRATVQQHVREGRFPGAVLLRGANGAARGFWRIPRAALAPYLHGKGKQSVGAIDELRPTGGP